MPNEAPQPEPASLADLLVAIATDLKAIRAAVQSAGVEAEGLSPIEAARFLGVSPAKLHAMNNSGELGPEPIGLGCGNCPRYARTELRAWILAGAPTRPAWKQLKTQAMRRAG